ncbi:unnamed protein product [Symbiodinium necroappetens]|uniref:C2H2-type domain-containing protein n=1 Tax=Symbiodinium necroappetens TaxID=1628268 RepID=A0A813BC14_9DINO|nr:unnamed protein product [Symbiodinium necroappetens]
MGYGIGNHSPYNDHGTGVRYLMILASFVDEANFEAYGEDIIVKLASAEGDLSFITEQAFWGILTLVAVPRSNYLILDLHGVVLRPPTYGHSGHVPNRLSLLANVRDDDLYEAAAEQIGSTVSQLCFQKDPSGFSQGDFTYRGRLGPMPPRFFDASIHKSPSFDGRLYCLILDPWIQWTSFLLHANLPVIGYGAAIPPVLDLADLLFDGDGWEQEPPLAFSSSFSHFWVLHEGGSRGIDADYHKIDTAYGFQEFAADALQFAHYRTTLKTAAPRVEDAVYKGVLCKAVVLVTECLPTLPVPPARITTPLTVVFLDMRPVLRGFEWRILVRGESDLEVFKQGLRIEVPEGFALRIVGGRPRVWNAAIDGFPCRSVIIVSEADPQNHADTSWILIDVRGLFLGWRSIPAPRGQISCRDILDDLLRELGSGWRLWFRDLPLHTDLLEVRTGQIFVVEVLHDRAIPPAGRIQEVQPDEAADGPVDALSHGSADRNPSASGDPGGSSAASAAEPHSVLGADGVTPDPPTDAGSHDRQGLQTGVAFAEVPFLLLKPNFAQVALVVCMPHWRHPGSIIAIDGRAINNRMVTWLSFGQSTQAFISFIAWQIVYRPGMGGQSQPIGNIEPDKQSLRALAFVTRFAGRCPPGYCIGRIVQGTRFCPLQDPFLIQDGDVVTLAFRGTQAETDELGPGPDDSPGPSGWGGEEDEPWRTLLEQTEEAISGEAFFLASTLVETLIEHFTPPSPAPPLAISLADHLPRWVQYDLSCVTLGLGKTFDDVAPFLQGGWPLPHTLPDGLRLRQATVRALADSSCSAASDTVGTEIYTDGSFNGRISAWAFAVIDLAPPHRSLKGWCRGTVALKGEPAYIGSGLTPRPLLDRLAGDPFNELVDVLAKGHWIPDTIIPDFRVLSWSPRHLFAKCIRGGLRFLIAVCHAPTATDPLRDSWWGQFAVDLRGYAGNLPVVILGDLNLRLTEPWGDSVGDLCWEEGASPPPPFLRLLAHHALWIPSTFTACHRGLSHTWVSPGQGALSRIDYVIVPQAWGADSGSSRVLYDVDFGQAGLDHYSVYLEASALLHASCSKGRRPPRIDVSCLHSPENASIVQAICKTAPAVPWCIDAHTHYDLFARHLVDHLALAFPAQQATKCKTFFSESTWSFRQQRVSLRKLAHRASAWITHYEIRIAWVAWCCEGPFGWAGLLSLADLLRSIADLRRSVGDLRNLKTTNAASRMKLHELQPHARPLGKTGSLLTFSVSVPLDYLGGNAAGILKISPNHCKSAVERCRANRMSCAIIFLDLKEAFHRVARALVHGGKPDEASIHNVIATLGLDPEVGPRLQAYVRDHSLIRAAGGPVALSSMVEETNCDTWFAHGVLEGTAVVKAGARPGDNLADLIFSFLFAELLKVLRQRFQKEGLSCALPWNEQWLGAGPAVADTLSPDEATRPIDVTWMDDLALLVADSRPEGLLDKVTAVATATLDECMKATLVPNLAEGKTECVIALYGPGSKKTAAAVFRGSSPDLPLHSSIWPDARLRLVSTYKHVGGLVQAGGGTSKEVRSRIGSAWAAFRQHRRQVFSSPLVQIRDKSVLFTAVVESTMFYGVGAWPAYDAAATLKFQGTLMSMARLMLRPRFSYMQARHLSGLYALSCSRILPAEASIALERLRHFRLVVSKGCAEFWALLHAEQSWLCQMQQALSWAGTLRGRAGLTDPDVSDWTTAADIARKETSRWKRLVKQTKVIAGLDSLWTAEVQQYHGLLFRQLRLAGAYLDEVVAEAASPEICAPCGQVFSDKRSWSHHAFKVHGRVREERQLVTGQQCPVCLRHYRSTEKLCNHVRYSSACKSALICAGTVVEPTPGVGSKKFLDGSKSQLPAVQAQGPTQQWQPDRPLFEEHRPSAEVLTALEDLLCNDSDTCQSYQDVLEAYRKAFSCHCLQLSRLRATAQEWQKRLQETYSSDEEWSVHWSSWHSKAADLIQRVSWNDWLVPDPAAPKFAVSTFKDASTQLPWLLFDHVHLPLPRTTGQIGRVVAEKDPGFGTFLSHKEASDSPERLDVDKWTAQSVANSVTLFSCLGLLASLTLLGPFRSYREVEPRLRSLRLLSDLVRGTFRLWMQGHPCVLIAHTLICPGLAALGKVAPFSVSKGDRTVFGNVPCTEFLSLFT